MKKLLVLIMTLITACSFFAVTVSATTNELSGKSFNSVDTYNVSKVTNQTPKTFEADILLDKSVNGRGGVIIGNYAGETNAFSFEIFENGNPRLYHNINKTTYNCVFNNVDVRLDSFVHLAIVYDAENNNVSCYLDGELKQTLSLTLPTYTYNLRPNVGGDLRSGNEQYFKGKIKTVSLYSDSRTASEVLADKTAIDINDENLLLSYELNDSNVLKFEDKSKNDNDLYANVAWVDNVPEPKDYAYSFMVIGDTQVLNKNSYNNESDKGFETLYDYVLDNLESKKVECVIGLGDITEYDYNEEWNLATENISRLDGKVNYTLVRGNHDSTRKYISNIGNNTDYKSQIDEWFAEGNILNVAQTFTAGKLKYLVISLDYGASDRILNWAGSLCEKYSDHNVIITTHAYLFRDGTTLDQNDACPPATSGGTNNGDHMWEKLVKKHPNIVMVLSGHDPSDNIVLTQTAGDNGNIVSQLLIDPQGVDASNAGGLGLVSTFYFSEDGKTVTVDWYSTIKQKYYKSTNQFTFTVNTVENSPKYTLTLDYDQTKGSLTLLDDYKLTNFAGETVSLKIEPKSGYLIDEVTFDGESVTVNELGIVTVNIKEKDSVLAVNFKAQSTENETPPPSDNNGENEKPSCNGSLIVTLPFITCVALGAMLLAKKKEN